MNICNCNSELTLLQKHWDSLTDSQRYGVIEDMYNCDCISTDILDTLILRCDTPHVDDISVPDMCLCLEVVDKMTTEELKVLETYMEMSLSDLKTQMCNSTVLYHVLQNYLVKHFTLNLPPLELFVIPDRYSIPMTIRRRARTHLKHHQSTTQHIP